MSYETILDQLDNYFKELGMKNKCFNKDCKVCYPKEPVEKEVEKPVEKPKSVEPVPFCATIRFNNEEEMAIEHSDRSKVGQERSDDGFTKFYTLNDEPLEVFYSTDDYSVSRSIVFVNPDYINCVEID